MQESFGARMRQWREQLDIPLATVAERTKIKLALLEALERDDLARWPTGIFRRSFVRSYASAIGLDPDVCVRDFLTCHPERVEPSARDLASPEEIEPPPTFLRQALGAVIGSLFHRQRAQEPRRDSEYQHASTEPAVPEYAPVKVLAGSAAGRKTSTGSPEPGSPAGEKPVASAAATSVGAAPRRPIKVDVPGGRPGGNRSNELGLATPAPDNAGGANGASGRVVALTAAAATTLPPVVQSDVSPPTTAASIDSAAGGSASDVAPPEGLAAEAAAKDAASSDTPHERRASDGAASHDVTSDAVNSDAVMSDNAVSTSAASTSAVPTGAAPEDALSAAIGADDAASDGLRLRIHHDPESVVPAASTPPGPDLLAAAQLCTALGQVSALGETAALLEDAVRILDAKGVIVWVVDPDTGELFPILAHGYSYRLLAQLPNVGRDDENATAAAFRSREMSIVNGGASAIGAIAVPLIAPGGCAGVLALELRNELVQIDTVRAVVTIFAAQLARVVDLAYPALMVDRKLA